MNNTTEQLTVALQELTKHEQVYGANALITANIATNRLALSEAVSKFLQERSEQLAKMRDVSIGTY